MKTGTQTHTYHGEEIWVRWAELKPHNLGHRQFVADYSLGAKASEALTQQSGEAVFSSHKAAANAALDRAMRAIDAAIVQARVGSAR
jgi:hypothetical protein